VAGPAFNLTPIFYPIEFVNNPLVNNDEAFTLGNAISFGQNSPLDGMEYTKTPMLTLECTRRRIHINIRYLAHCSCPRKLLQAVSPAH
jgi:hypothetical protein